MKSALAIKLFLLSSFMFLLHCAAFAQPANPDDPSVPLTGIELLIGAGALLGARKLARLRNKK